MMNLASKLIPKTITQLRHTLGAAQLKIGNAATCFRVDAALHPPRDEDDLRREDAEHIASELESVLRDLRDIERYIDTFTAYHLNRKKAS